MEEPLTIFDGLPTLFDGREVPPLASLTYDPETPLVGIESKTAANGEMLHNLVLTQRVVTEHAGGIHE
jgi:hypothetical protein